MAVTSFKEIHNGREGGEQLSATGTTSRYIRVFRAITDSATDEASTVKSYTDCPKVGEAYPYDSWAVCRNVKASNETFSKKVWLVTCEYSTVSIKFPVPTPIQDPLAEPAVITWETQPFQKLCLFDKDGTAIKNSAGDPFQDPVTRDDLRWTAVVVKNVAAVPSWILTYRDAVNSAAFLLDGLTIPVGAAKLMGISIGGWERRNDIPYKILTFRIALGDPELAPDGNPVYWRTVVLDAGYNELVGGKPEPIRSELLERLGGAPARLNGSGVAINNPATASSWLFLTSIRPRTSTTCLSHKGPTMSDELKINSNVTLEKGSYTYKFFPGQVTMDITNARRSGNVQTVGATAEALVWGTDITTEGFAIIRNLSTTVWAKVGPQSGTIPVDCLYIPPGKYVFLWLEPSTTWYGYGDGGSLDLQIDVFDS